MTTNGATPAATNPCGTGGGVVKPGYDRAIYIGAAAAEALAAEFGTPATAVILAPVIAAGTYDLLHICTNGDPGDPGLTALDLVYALTPGDFINSPNAWSRIQQWFTHMMWPTWCDCANGTIPPAPTTAPLPTASNNPGLPQAPGGASCWHATQSWGYDANNNPLIQNERWLWNDGRTHTPNSNLRFMPPPGPWELVVHQKYIPGPSWPALGPSTNFLTYDVNDVLLQNVTIPPAANLTLESTVTFVPDPKTDHMQVVPYPHGPPGQHMDGPTFGALTLYCNGNNPATPETPCCPPDPLIDQKLNAIIQMLQQLALGSTPSDTYVNGPVHTGLSGNASFTLAKGTIGIQVHVTSDISHFFTGSQNPPYYFSLGFVTPVAVGAPLRGARLIYGRQIYPLQPEADQVYLALASGVVLDVTELKAGIR